MENVRQENEKSSVTSSFLPTNGSRAPNSPIWEYPPLLLVSPLDEQRTR